MTDQELTQLQETGSVQFSQQVNLGYIVEGLDTLGVDPNHVIIWADDLGIEIEVTKDADRS
jgi:uncharacterized protein (AIM24 family)